MVSKDVKKGIAILFSIAVLSFSITGCGGGGGSAGDSTPAESEHVVLDANNSGQAINTVFNEIGTGFDFKSPLASMAAAKSVPTTKVLEHPAAVKQVLSTSQNISSVPEGDPISCTDGGFITYNDTEIIFSDCNESGMIIDGTVAVSGDETSATMTFTNFSITMGSDIVFYESMTYSYTLNAEYEIISMSITMDGYTCIFGERTDYQNYIFSISWDSSYTVTTYSINGFIKTDCLGGWIEITTTEDIQKNLSEPCPTAGQIVISGNASSITIDFNPYGMGGVNVTVSGSATEYYDSCLNVPGDSCSL